MLAAFSIVWCHAVLNSLRLTKNNSRHFSVAYFPELLRILHNFLSQFINCNQHLELVDICGSKEEITVKSYEIPNLPIKNKQTNIFQSFESL